MTGNEPTQGPPGGLFDWAEWYERTINWSARLRREVPVLAHVFGPPGAGGLLDAGCGTGHQASALAQRGYQVVGADVSEAMLAVARRGSSAAAAAVRFVRAPYHELHAAVGDGFDGVYCLGNALAAAGGRDLVRDAIVQFARCLRRGGRLFVQILNFPPMRQETPCVRGPRVCETDGVRYVSVRQFHFSGDTVQVTNITIFNDGGWKQQAHCGVLYPATLDELRPWCDEAGLRIEAVWGGYERTPFDAGRSTDLILEATRR